LIKATGISQPGQVAPDSDEGVLRRVASVRLVAEDRHRGSERGAQSSVDDRFERLAIAASGAFYEECLRGPRCRSSRDDGHHLPASHGVLHTRMTPAARRWLIFGLEAVSRNRALRYDC
jgi:hypothetical protein